MRMGEKKKQNGGQRVNDSLMKRQGENSDVSRRKEKKKKKKRA